MTDPNVFDLFALQAAATPDTVAVLGEDGEATYGDLAARADEICRYLLGNGLAAEQPVGVLMRRDTGLPAVLLGIWKAGGAYVPIDPDEPPDRMRRLLDSADCGLVLGHAALLDRLRPLYEDKTQAPAFVDVASIAASSSGEAPPIAAPGGSRLAYLLFTSGSTGEPKAVEVEHRSVVHLLRTVRDLISFTAADRYLAVSTIGFDVSVAELFLPLITGGSLLLRDRTILLEPKTLAQQVRAFGVTVMQTGPSVWSVLLNDVPDFPKVRVAISTGEAISPDRARMLARQGEQVWNLYGPTEATIWATAQSLVGELTQAESEISAPIGRPLDGLRALIVGEDGAAVPDGERGELCIGGVCVARGYRGNGALTRERFVEIGGARVYRTGDIAMRDATGVLHYFGRNDDQLKIRGIRVEPGEVEAAILRDDGIAQAAATWFETRSGTRAIVAAVVLPPGIARSEQDLHARLRGVLPAAMIPARFLFVPWLPIGANGKVDRTALRQAASAAPETPRPDKTQPLPELAGALSDTEALVAGVWRRLIDRETVTSDDHFFSIGGDSLAAVQMMVEVESLLDIKIPMQVIFEAPTLKDFAGNIDRLRARAGDDVRGNVIFQVVKMPGVTPLFFCGVDLAVSGRWRVPCPLYAIALWARGVGFVKKDSIDSISATYLAEIRRIQPAGPYRLGGYSLGGLIALEMAQQLRRQGEDVELLFLLDPMRPFHAFEAGPEAPQDPFFVGLTGRVARYLRRIWQSPRELGFRNWLAKLTVPIFGLPGGPWLLYHLVHLHIRYPNPVSQKLLPRDRWPAFWYGAKRATMEYVARPYDGRTLALFTEDTGGVEIWRSLFGTAAEIRQLEATHADLFQDTAIDLWMPWLSNAVSPDR